MNNIIFVLEDMPARIPIFKKIARDTEMNLVHVDNVEEAKVTYEANNPSVVFLDHDLELQQFVDSSEDNTGYQFAKWIVENDENYKQRTIIIHSANPVGAENILNALNGEAYIVPIMYFVRDQHVLYDNGLLKIP